MLHSISERIAVFLFDKESNYPFEIYTYGIELMISSLIGTTLVLFLGLISGYLLESIIFMLSLSLIRFFSGGYHAKTYLRCNSIFLISAILVFLAHHYYIQHLLMYNSIFTVSIFVVSFVVLIIFAPVENENKIIEEHKKVKFKAISISFVFIELLMSFVFYNYLGFDKVLVILPTIIVVDISVLIEIILNVRRNKNENCKTKGIKGS